MRRDIDSDLAHDLASEPGSEALPQISRELLHTPTNAAEPRGEDGYWQHESLSHGIAKVQQSLTWTEGSRTEHSHSGTHTLIG